MTEKGKEGRKWYTYKCNEMAIIHVLQNTDDVQPSGSIPSRPFQRCGQGTRITRFLQAYGGESIKKTAGFYNVDEAQRRTGCDDIRAGKGIETQRHVWLLSAPLTTEHEP